MASTVAPPRRAPPTTTTTSSSLTASPELLETRIRHLLPISQQRARDRLVRLKKLYATPRVQLVEAHDRITRDVVRRLRLTQSIRNVRVASNLNNNNNTSSSASSVVGSLCMPLCSIINMGAGRVVSGAVDGLLTMWRVRDGTSMCSTSSCSGRQSWGRVRGICALPSRPNMFATAAMFDEQIRVWEVVGDDGVEMHQRASTIKNNNNNNKVSSSSIIHQLAADPTGHLLGSAGADGCVRLWDLQRMNEDELCTLEVHDGYDVAVRALSFHVDGSLVSSADDGGRIITWDLRSGALAFASTHNNNNNNNNVKKSGGGGGHAKAATCVCWSPCGSRLASGGADAVIHVWDARMLHQHAQTRRDASPSSSSSSAVVRLLGHEDAITSIAFYDALGTHTVLPMHISSTSLDHSLRVWSCDNGLEERRLEAAAPVYAHCFTHDNNNNNNNNNTRTENEDDVVVGDGKTKHEQRTLSPAAIVSVGHSKYWSVWDVMDDDDVREHLVRETEDIAATLGGGGAANINNNNNDEDDEESSDDEMAALRRPAAAPQPNNNNNNNNGDDDEDDEDEMELLRRRKE